MEAQLSGVFSRWLQMKAFGAVWFCYESKVHRNGDQTAASEGRDSASNYVHSPYLYKGSSGQFEMEHFHPCPLSPVCLLYTTGLYLS